MMAVTRPKLHVILQKEAIVPELIDKDKVAVVFDVLLATTTIATLLHHGAKKIIPVMDGEEALKVAASFEKSTTIIAGESEGLTIEGFVDPLPTLLKDVAKGKTIILSTTNGTVAIRHVCECQKGIRRLFDQWASSCTKSSARTCGRFNHFNLRWNHEAVFLRGLLRGRLCH